MSARRKTTPGSKPAVRKARAGHTPASAAYSASCERMLVEAAGIAPQRVLIVTCDGSGALRMWCNSVDPFHGLALTEYARSRLQVAAMRDDEPV